MVDLTTSLTDALGARTGRLLARALDLRTVGDLLGYYPRRYEQRGRLTDFAQLQVGEHVTVLAEVRSAQSRLVRGRTWLLDVQLSDGQRQMRAVWFNQRHLARRLTVGSRGYFSGKVSTFGGRRELANPRVDLVDGEDEPTTRADELVPVYPATAAVSSPVLARSTRQVLDLLGDVDDPLPPVLRDRHALPDLRAALQGMHRPSGWDVSTRARERLKWDEAFGLQVVLAQRRRAASEVPAQPRPRRPDGLLAAFDAALPFPLTKGQREVGERIAYDLGDDVPMHRLLQGEVGSGKTVVALRAMLQVVDAGAQAALLAPTEVLAAQHVRSLHALLGPLGRAGQLDGAETATRVALLTGSQGSAARRTALAEAAQGDAGIVVGTHALLSEGVEFADLGLVVVDEQHRFGVEQRDALRGKGLRPPHLLVMTATPIPRTVAMTVYGDLETSVLAELPAGRIPIRSHVVPAADKPHYLDRAWQRVREEVAAGHQAYVVCPRIGDDGEEPGAVLDDEAEDEVDVEGEVAAASDPGHARPGGTTSADARPRRPPLAVLDVAAALAAGPLSGVAVGVLHGRLPPEAKEQVMRDFTAGALQVLVATTVIEVGVDVPNATVMVVLDAERFGVSQLHQLRGRVGRGRSAGLCLLVTEAPDGSPSRERLEAVAATTDGFALARIDLEQRREGDVLGADQSGRQSSLKLLQLLRDEPLIAEARREAMRLVEQDPDLSAHPRLRAAVAARFGAQRAEFLDKA